MSTIDTHQMTAPVPITSVPAAGQLVEHQGKTYETVREGAAFILIPPGTQISVDPQSKPKADASSTKPQNVFYNPIQQFNRDLSVLAIKAFGEDYTERKKVRTQRSREKTNKKNARKRKRASAEAEAADEDTSGMKVRKTEDGRSDISAPEAILDTNAEGDGGVSIELDPATGSVEPQAASIASEEAPSADFQLRANGHSPKSTEPQFRILDALSATGLRALRYAKEIPFLTAVVANDMNPNATKSMALNIQHNRLSSYITPNTGDAIGHMYSVAYPPPGSHGPHHVNSKYDVVDLDPYGTAAPFLDAALQATNDGGLLCVTCTDSGVFASTGYCEKTYSLYGGMPVKGPYMHEGGIRLIIHSIASTAAKYGISIEPLLSLSIDFYARVFIRVRKSAADVKFLAGKTMVVYACDHGCGAWMTNMLGRNTKQDGKGGNVWYKHSIAQAPGTDRTCEHCGSKTHVAGPMWGGPIHNAAFIEKILHDMQSADNTIYETMPRIEGMLTTALDELLVKDEVTKYSPTATDETDMVPKVPPEVVDQHPFFINPSALSKVIHCVAPSSAAMNGALRHAGYRATRSHCQAGSIKTDAPWTAIWEIMREWVRQKQPIKEGVLKKGTPGYQIMMGARKPKETSAENAATTQEPKEETPEIITDIDRSPVAIDAATPKRIRVVFDEVLGKDKPGKRLIRYQQNPRENWGPMTKAKGSSNAKATKATDTASSHATSST